MATPSSTQSTASRRDQQQQLYVLHQELLDRLKRPQTIAERDTFAEWVWTTLHGMDSPILHRCQYELMQVIHKYQEM
jgi:hypothetical protein